MITIKKPFVWTDKTVLEFAKVTSSGAYGKYEDCRSVKKKLKRFKELKFKRIMKTIALSDLLSKEEIKEVTKFMDANKDAELKHYLNEPSRKKSLEEKGVLADYLYYNLQYQKTKTK